MLALVALSAAAGSAPGPLACLGKHPTIVGTEQADVIEGTAHRDVIAALGGDDVVRASGGKDFVCGGEGDDVLGGGARDDVLDGGTGFDVASFADASGPIMASLEAGAASGDGDDTLSSIEGLVGSPMADVLTGDSGANALDGGPGDDALDGGPGPDTATYTAAPGPVTADLTAGTAVGAGSDTLASIESVIGSPYDDDLFGDGGANRLEGGAGADLLHGEGGDDALLGEAGDDILRGGAGVDTLAGGDGAADECVDGETLTRCDRVGDGALRMHSLSSFDYIDPAFAYFSVSWQYLNLVCTRLVSYPDAPAPAGAELVPDAAVALPSVSADGRTYTFRVRDGLRFAPPSGAPVTAAAFKASIERALAPALSGPAVSFLSDVVGVDAYLAGQAGGISGIVADGQTLTFTLTAPHGDLPARLSMPFFCVLPVGTPATPGGFTTPVPSAGPYYLTSYTSRAGATLERNPYYRGRRASTFDHIEWYFGADLATQAFLVESGVSDHGAVPPARVEELNDLYGPGSPAAIAGRQRFFVAPQTTVWYLALNTERPLFADANLRRAVAYAIDRSWMTAQHGPLAGTATDQLLMPGLPGYVDWSVYPVTPDMALAAHSAALAGVTPTTRVNAVMYTFNVAQGLLLAAHVQAALAPLGIDVEIQTFDRVVQHTKAATRGEPFDITIDGWGLDYLDPYNLVDALLHGDRIVATNNVNISYFDDPVFNARLDAASALSGPERYSAYAELDRDLSVAAPLVPYVNTNARLFFSDRIGCHTFVPFFGPTALNTLCVRPG